MLLLLFFFETAYAASPSNLLPVSATTATALQWTSIGLAVLTAFLQGMVTSLAFMTEDSNYWTFRFRLAKIEHGWWTLVTMLLLASLVLIILTFLSGNNNDSLGILALASASSLTIVQYMIPAWRCRHFIANRWLAWTGDSRTGVDVTDARLCGDTNLWRSILAAMKRSEIKSVPSDWYGWQIYSVGGIPEDPTDILRHAKTSVSTEQLQAKLTGRFSAFVYDDGNTEPRRVSLLWGRAQHFRRRVSRATSSMPACLLKSKPFTQDGYAGEGLCLAMGILGRNKGLNPAKLVFDTSGLPSGYMEDNSAWEPRPAKVLRSCYAKAMEAQYHGLGRHYVHAAVELSLILMDCAPETTAAWLRAGLEHQCLALNVEIRTARGVMQYELDAHYRSSYASMILSLNNATHWSALHLHSINKNKPSLVRPDLICTGILLMAENKPKPEWWDTPVMHNRRVEELAALGFNWRHAALCLLGMNKERIAAAGGEDKLWCFETRDVAVPVSEVLPEEPVVRIPRPFLSSLLRRAFTSQVDHDSEGSAAYELEAAVPQ